MQLAETAPSTPAQIHRYAFTTVAAVLWTITGVSLGLIAVLALLLAIWAASTGAIAWLASLLGLAAVIVALAALLLHAAYEAPGFRRLSPPVRLTLLGTLAAPAPAWLAAHFSALLFP